MRSPTHENTPSMEHTEATGLRIADSAPWRLLRNRGLVALAALLIAYLVLVPLGVLGISSLRPTGLVFDDGWTFSHYFEVFTNARFVRVLARTVFFGVLTTAIAVSLGAAFAWLIERTDMPGARLFRLLIILPMAMPPLLLAMAWILILSPTIGFGNTILSNVFGDNFPTINIYTMTGMIIIQGIAFVPTSFLIQATAMRNMDTALEESATASGASLWTVIRRITLPMMAPNVLAAAIYLFIISILVFDVPGLIGMRGGIFVLSSEVYYHLSGREGIPSYGTVGALAMVPLVVLLPLAFAYQRLLRRANRFVTISTRGFRRERIRLGRLRYVATAAVSTYFLVGVVAPLVVLVLASLLPYFTELSVSSLSGATLDNYLALWQNSRIRGAAWNTLILGVVVATALAMAAPALSSAIVRGRSALGRLIDRLTFLPLALSNIIIGTALLLVYLEFRTVPIYGTIWIIVIAHITAYLTFSTRTMNGALLQIDSELEAAGRVAGGSARQVAARITYPLLRPTMYVVWLWVAAHSMRELSAALILASRDNQVISTTLWSYWDSSQGPTAAALGVVLMVVLSALALTWDRISGRGSW